MNYIIDFAPFSSFYSKENKEDDEKPPPDLKNTGGQQQIEERVIKKAVRRKAANEGSEGEEIMSSAPRKEKSAWPDWQFWKRSDGFSAFRKTTKTQPTTPPTTNQPSNGFTFRKEYHESSKGKSDEAAIEHSDLGVARNVVQVEHKGRKCELAGCTNLPRPGKAERDDPMVCYKENNGSKHVVLNMNKVETLKDSRRAIPARETANKITKEEKYLRKNEDFAQQKRSKVITQAPQSEKHGFCMRSKVAPEQQRGGQVKRQPTSKAQCCPMVATKKAQGNIDEKPHSSGAAVQQRGFKQVRFDDEGVMKNNNNNGFGKTMKNSDIPVPKVQPKKMAEKQQAEAENTCTEQGKLHSALKKGRQQSKPGITSTPENENTCAPAQNIPQVTAEAHSERVGTEQQHNAPEQGLADQEEPLVNVTKKHTSQKASRRHNALQHGKTRTNLSQKPLLESGVRSAAKPGKLVKKLEKIDEESLHGGVKKPEARLHLKPPVMKDASTMTTPLPRATVVDVAVQVPADSCIMGNEQGGCVDETASLLEKRPWDTERVMKMQVLLDEKEVVIGRLKDAGRKQRDELRACRKRCAGFDKVMKQANMEGKPQLVMQINELTDIQNELVEEISTLTVDMERERSTVKVLKNDLAELKGQLSSARKRNTATAIQ